MRNSANIDTDKLTTLLSERESPEIRLALLFGSRGSGNARQDSDIDLALLCTCPITNADRLDLLGEIGSTFGLPVDLVDLYHAPYPVTGEALGGRRLIGDNETYACLAVRHVTNREDFGMLHDRLLNRRLDKWLQM